MADTFIALTNKPDQRPLLINVARINFLEPGTGITGTRVGVAPIGSPQIEVLEPFDRVRAALGEYVNVVSVHAEEDTKAS